LDISDKIELINTENLIPYHNNPKEHPPEQIDKIASSIKNYGFVQPLVVDGEHEIIIGHGRLEAAKKLGLEEVPVVVKEDLNDAQIKALRIADNKVADSEWDYEALGVELESLEIDDFTGFEEEEINDITEPNTDEIKEDNFDIENNYKEKYITRKNNLIELGSHKLFCGDSTSPEDIGTLMDGATADMIFTDPPYNVNYEGQNGMKIENDNMDNEDFYHFLYDFYSTAFDVTKEGGAIYVCHADSEGLNFRKAFEDAGWLMKQCLIWIKSSLVMGRQDYQWRHEPILYGWKPGAAHTWNNDRKQTTVIEPEIGVKILKNNKKYQITTDTAYGSVVLEVPDYKIINNDDDSIQTTWFFKKPNRNAEHPTMKPVKLVARAIKNSSKVGDTILDPFSGSGSTLIAAEQLDRQCYMMELDEHYCDVIIRRYISYKKDKSEKINIKVNGKEIDYNKYLVD
jgi:DNA modification methylase